MSNQNCKENIEQIEKAFITLIKMIQLKEVEIINILKTEQKQNVDIYESIKKTLENQNETIDKLLQNHGSIDQYTVEGLMKDNKHIQLIKDNDQAKKLIESKLKEEFLQYREHTVTFDQNKINELFDQVKLLFTEENSEENNDKESIEKLTLDQLDV